LADEMPLDPDRAAARARFGLPMHASVLAVLPGSRLGEIERMGPPFLAAAAIVRAALPDLAVLVPAANAGCRTALERLLEDGGDSAAGIRLLDGEARAAMEASDVVLMASGTAALEG